MTQTTGAGLPTFRLVRPSREPATAPVLDDAQRRVVDHPGGPLLVLAGPGTGKTTTLVEAVVDRVRNRGVPVDEILMLTFSRRAAGEMRDRVTSRLGGTVREPIARTFHSYAFGLLRLAAVARQEPAPRLLSGPEQDLMIRELLANADDHGAINWPENLRPALRTRAFAAELRDLLLRAVERGLSGADLAEFGRAHRRPDWVAAGTFLQQYRDVTVLERPGAYDPAELIRAAIDELQSDSELLTAERRRRRRIFVDEYQDVDPAQVELLRLLATGADELVVVGDPDQSIYAFRGSDANAIREMPHLLAPPNGDVPTVALRVSRRAGATLVAASRRVADRLTGPLQHRRLIAAPDLPSGSLDVALLASHADEANYIADVLRRAHLEDGVPWDRMAVLARSSGPRLAVLRRACATAGVPIAAAGDDLPLSEQPAVAHILQAMRAALHPDQLTDDLVQDLLTGPIGGADSLQLHRLRRELLRLGDESDESLWPALVTEPGMPARLPDFLARPVERVARVLSAGRESVARGGDAETVLWSLWQASGLARRWFAASLDGGSAGAAAGRDLDAVVELFDVAARFTDRLPHASPDALYEHVAGQQIPGDSMIRRTVGQHGVALLTAHASKGLEWDVVCVAGMQEGIWPDLRRRGSLLGADLLVDLVAQREAPQHIQVQLGEERRLFYVAVTRGRQRVVVTAISDQDEQPSRFLDELDPVDGERPLRQVPRGLHLPALVSHLRATVSAPETSDDLRRAAATELARLAAEGVAGAHPQHWWGLVELADDGPFRNPQDGRVRVSPSRLEAYGGCELAAMLAEIGARDGQDEASASLGSLIHAIAAKIDDAASIDDLEQALDADWSGLDFAARWLAQTERQRAHTMLEKLVSWLQASRSGLEFVGAEVPFRVQIGELALLSGRVDRLERDHEGRLVVVDFKTGTNQPTGRDLPRHAQLGAYQLAAELGGFTDGEPAESGGARLVQLGTNRKTFNEQAQPAIAGDEDPEWVAQAVTRVAEVLMGAGFTATVSANCERCPSKRACPCMPDGRQVTSS